MGGRQSVRQNEEKAKNPTQPTQPTQPKRGVEAKRQLGRRESSMAKKHTPIRRHQRSAR